MSTTTSTPTWNPEQDTAVDQLLAAWVRTDDLRRTRTATFAQLHDALVELQDARRAVREARRRDTERVLAA